MAGLGFDLLHDPMDVILDRKLGQAQAGRNFLIRHSLRDQRHELPLPKSQASLEASFLVGQH